jgi:hypothetical protein
MQAMRIDRLSGRVRVFTMIAVEACGAGRNRLLE